ncbi:hypothetical protein JOB18_037603 [Solea senegalensis]|uniref:Uncharacterized protein n=1 Tax=Solea senegalensis TaxID=28829 RepID=A0AAV6STQ8_SOLSE|nr:hypothetical protein JOB18_037603 [Solea senegalensis]
MAKDRRKLQNFCEGTKGIKRLAIPSVSTKGKLPLFQRNSSETVVVEEADNRRCLALPVLFNMMFLHVPLDCTPGGFPPAAAFCNDPKGSNHLLPSHRLYLPDLPQRIMGHTGRLNTSSLTAIGMSVSSGSWPRHCHQYQGPPLDLESLRGPLHKSTSALCTNPLTHINYLPSALCVCGPRLCFCREKKGNTGVLIDSANRSSG